MCFHSVSNVFHSIGYHLMCMVIAPWPKVMSYVCHRHTTMEDVATMVFLRLFVRLRDHGACFYVAILPLLCFKNGGFDFCEGASLMTHRVTPLTNQSVACSLLTKHFLHYHSCCYPSIQFSFNDLAPNHKNNTPRGLYIVM